MLRLVLPLLAIQAPAAPPSRPDLIESCHVIDGERAVLTGSTSGVIRRVELDEMRVTATTEEHIASAYFWMEEVTGPRFVVAAAGGHFTLRSTGTLETLGSIHFGPDLDPMGLGALAIDPTGRRATAAAKGARLLIGEFGDDGGTITSVELPARAVDVAFDHDGDRLVALVGTTLQIVELPSGAPPKLLEPLQLPAELEGTMVEFNGDGQIAVGMHERSDPMAPSVFLRLVDPARGGDGLQVETSSQLAPLGGVVTSLDYLPESGLLTYGISSAGSVVALDASTLEFRWALEFGGGNPGGIGVRQPPGSARCFSYGMTPRHRAIVDCSTGKVSGRGALEGYSDLDAPAGDDLIVAVKDGRLVVLDGLTLEERHRGR